MGILDEAIREHLELKRKHGAEQSELQQIEDEAFGPPARPDELSGDVDAGASEAPTRFMPLDDEEAAVQQVAEAQPAAEPPVEEVQPSEFAPPEPPAEPEPPGEPEPVAEAAPQPDVEEHPAAELPLGEAPPSESSSAPTGLPDTAEREAIAAQPTELHDVAAELAAEDAAPPAEDAPPAETVEPPAGEEAEAEASHAFEEDFFDEQSLSDELDQALDAAEDEAGAPPEAAPPADPEAAPPADPEAAPPAEPEPDAAVAGDAEPEPEAEPPSSEAFYDQENEDVLEETPEFLQDTPENERLWFEQKPPKDFDFDD
jgi:hypothetical protein